MVDVVMTKKKFTKTPSNIPGSLKDIGGIETVEDADSSDVVNTVANVSSITDTNTAVETNTSMYNGVVDTAISRVI